MPDPTSTGASGSPEGPVTGSLVSRRTFLGGMAAGAGVLLIGCTERPPSSGAASSSGVATATSGSVTPAVAGYGPLVDDPAGVLSLPEGFSYRVLAQEGETRLESGEVSPSKPDGAATFPRRDAAGTVLVTNHEVGRDGAHPVPHLEGLVYDPRGKGGTTTLVLDADGRVERHYVSLAGTHINCAGGRTPWDTWLTCEESEATLDRRHGYVFEVDPYDEAANRNPRPITALGRFAHEAVVVDEAEDVLYLTEDANEPHGLLYRWTAPEEARPLGRGSLRQLADDAGTLEALRATTEDGRHVPDLSAATEIGTTYRVGWVAVPDRDATEQSVRRQFGDDEITRGRKLEGMWWGDDGAYVVCSYAREDDGSAGAHDGQVWFLDPRAGTLTLRLRFAVAEDGDVQPDGPDNITVSPYGGVIIAEDGDGLVHLLGTTASGEVFFFARSDSRDDGEEFCGPVFSPDRRQLFANLQGSGRTFLIEGPFREQP